MFLSSPLGEAAERGRPDITFVGGFGTENGTRGVAVGDVRYWLDDRIQTVAGLIKSSVNLDFYGLGEAQTREPLRYNLEPEGGLVQAKYRLGDSALWAGLGYAYVATAVSFEAPQGTPRLPDFERTSHIGGLAPSLTWDTRDNVFTPTDGTYVEANVGVFSPSLGSDDDFQRAHLLAMDFRPLAPGLFLGVRGQVTSAFGDAPFYMQPFVGLRGVPVMRYQGETAADLEAELLWQVWNRVSLVGFAGAGATWSGFERIEDTQTVFSGGVGIRYELARAYGIHVGLDVAFSGGSAALYVQIGSAWARP
jgi:outer membrane protein assembly factor BamA